MGAGQLSTQQASRAQDAAPPGPSVRTSTVAAAQGSGSRLVCKVHPSKQGRQHCVCTEACATSRGRGLRWHCGHQDPQGRDGPNSTPSGAAGLRSTPCSLAVPPFLGMEEGRGHGPPHRGPGS